MYNQIADSKKAPTRREQQRQERRWVILAAAAEAFARKGYAATKVADIARGAGMSMGLMFHYFESKEDLLAELVELGANGPEGILDSADELPPLDYLQEIARQVFSYMRDVPLVGALFVLMGRVRSDDSLPKSIRDMGRKKEDVIAKCAAKMSQGQRDGTIKPGDPHALALAFWMAIEGIAEEVAMNPQCPCPQPEWLVDIVKNHE